MEKIDYKTPNPETPIDFINCDDLANMAQKIIPAGGWGYISGAAGDEITLKENTSSFENKKIYPRVLADLEKPDISTSILETKIKSPIIMAPAASHKLAHDMAEKDTAKGVAAAETIMCISGYSNETIEDIASYGEGGLQWYQLYLSKDDRFNRFVVETAVKTGAKAIILTVDATVGGNREADRRNNFKMPFSMANLEKFSKGQGLSIAQIFANAKQNISKEDILRIKELSKLPVIVKGIQCAEDALLAIGAGADAIWVSNHGGRQLDGGPASFDVLEEVANAVDKLVPIIFDSGIRRGQHVFKALASGADIVAIGRPALYGLALGGWQGVKSVFDYFNKELQMVMQLTGCRNIEDAKKALLK